MTAASLAARRATIKAAIFAVTFMHACLVQAADGPCTTGGSNETRQTSTRALAELNDIGRPDSSTEAKSPFSIAPDGTRVAFIERRARPDSNDFCQMLVVMQIGKQSRVRFLADAGQPVMTEIDNLRGLTVPTGLFKEHAPAFSPDGKSIAFLKPIDGIVQIEVVDAASGRTEASTKSDASIEDFAWLSEGRSIRFTVKAELNIHRAQIQVEALSGFHYDDRIVANAGPTPFPPGPSRMAQRIWDLGNSPIRADDAAEPGPTGSGVDGEELTVVSSTGRRAWVALDRPDHYPSNESLWISDGQSRRRCEPAVCHSGIFGLWWSARGDRLFFMRREGWAESQVALYSWAVGRDAPKRTLLTNDVLSGCQLSDDRLICVRDAYLQPKYIARLDPLSGASEKIYDPNPHFAADQEVEVTRLTWKTSEGSPSFGNLVLPRKRPQNKKLPLVIVQYRARGFLRGGVGDEVPILPLASRGFAVLEVERPQDFAAGTGRQWKNWEDAEKTNIQDWRDRKNTLNSIEQGIRLSLASGVIDPNRIAITGMSDGATTALFALINSRRFAVASLATCCNDPATDAIMGGPAWTPFRVRQGYPEPGTEAPEFWKPISLAMNAQRLRTPILMQLADDEYLRALEGYDALSRAGVPVDLFVFPGEHHVKWQPAHRLAVYNRNLAWLAFWLLGEVGPEASTSDVQRWTALRKRLEEANRSTHAPGPDPDLDIHQGKRP